MLFNCELAYLYWFLEKLLSWVVYVFCYALNLLKNVKYMLRSLKQKFDRFIRTSCNFHASKQGDLVE